MATSEEIKKMQSEIDFQVMQKELERLKTENDELKKKVRPVTFTITDRGAISVNGIGKYPFTLFRTQWERVLEHSTELKKFIKDNESDLN